MSASKLAKMAAEIDSQDALTERIEAIALCLSDKIATGRAPESLAALVGDLLTTRITEHVATMRAWHATPEGAEALRKSGAPPPTRRGN